MNTTWLCVAIGLMLAIMPSFCGERTPQQAAQHSEQSNPKPTWAIAIHGGTREKLPIEERELREKQIREHLLLGQKILAEGGTAMDACEQVLRALEDDPLFDLGKGAAYTAEGKHALDASFMDGQHLRLGAVAGVRTVKNPISLARMVMEKTPHVMLIRNGAEAFAEQMDLEMVPNTYFDTPHQARAYELWCEIQRAGTAKPREGGDTGGCVCLDQFGNLAAGTSTGGLMGAMPGRVGDSPICGAGTYANNRTCAVSGTGIGEEFIRHNVAHTISALMDYKGLSAQEAADEVIHKTLGPGVGGVIVISHDGKIATAFNTMGMFRGCADSNGRFEYGVLKETIQENAAPASVDSRGQK